MDELIEKLRSVKWEVIDDDDWDSRCVFVDMRPDDFEALLTEAAAVLEAAREDGWQPIETAPKPDIGANGFGKRLLLVVDCGDGTTPSVRKGYWGGTDWYLDRCISLATSCGYRVTHWRPLPEPPAIDAAQPKRRPYNASGSLSEYGIFPECDAYSDWRDE